MSTHGSSAPRRIKDILIEALSIVAVTATVSAMIYKLKDSLGVGTNLLIPVVTALAGAALGLGAKYLAGLARTLQTKSRVLLSYSRDNEATGKQIADDLRNAGMKVWVDSERIQPGEDWQLAIREAIRDADVLVLLLTKSLNPYLDEELKEALKAKLKIIPVSFESAELPQKISSLSYEPYTSSSEIAKAVVKAVG